jgi:hypothetical protein
MNYTDDQLKQALAKMLPDCQHDGEHLYIYDKDFGFGGHRQVLDTELLHLCWLVENSMSVKEANIYLKELESKSIKDNWWVAHATWQQRTIALCKVKGIEI